jgi:hypothetical protein
LFIDDVAVAVSTHVATLVSIVAVFAVVFAVVVVIASSVAVYELIFGVALSMGLAAVVTMLGGGCSRIGNNCARCCHYGVDSCLVFI